MSLRVRGVVQRHLGRGRKLGFPTANIPLHKEVSDGTYLGFVKFNGDKFPALVFVGAPETFEEIEKRVEAYMLDFDRDLYDQEIEVEFVQKLRDNIKFDSQDELIAQMKDDERRAREFFKTFGRTE